MDPEPPKASRAPKSPYALARRSLKWHRGLVAASGVALLLVPLSTPLATYLGFEGDSYRRLVGTAALGVGAGGTVALGFISLGLFGLALSAPLVLAMLWQRGRRLLDWLAGLSVRVPIVIGLVLIGLGLWSVYFGLFVDLADWT